MALKNKNIIVIVVLVVLGGALIAFGAFQGRTKERVPSQSFEGQNSTSGLAGNGVGPKAELQEVRTWTRRDCSLAPWLITDKLGYFAEEGIKLIFTGELQAPQQVPSIIKGDNDVATAHPNVLAVAVNGGANFKGVARGVVEPRPDQDETFRHMWWFVNPKKYPNVKSFKDLKNIEGTLKFSIISTTQCTDFLTYKIFDNYGLPRDKIEWVTMPDVQAIQALSQELTDVGAVHPPFYKGMIEAGNLKIGDSLESGLEGETAGLTFYYFNEKFISSHEETVRGFIRAIGKGQRWINENPEQARIWTQEAIGIPVSANHYYAQDLRVRDFEVDPWIEELEFQGALPKGKLKSSDLISHLYDQESLEATAPNL
ncbi:MAG: ABC transporter substrate-binding protein [Deltaproteobacteria bacterium]|jgi:ABC-type nitrate/sulfonate/bicarbonate transport system substrate-binding protein|nr:ABC transporter substrate-binding protein [Deltaproteobacteria bacterium]